MKLYRDARITAWSKAIGPMRGPCSITVEINYGVIRGEVDISVSEDDLERLERMDGIIRHANQVLDGIPPATVGVCPEVVPSATTPPVESPDHTPCTSGS